MTLTNRPTPDHLPPGKGIAPWNFNSHTKKANPPSQRALNVLLAEEVTQLIRAAKGNARDHCLLATTYEFGLRPCEPGLIRLSDLDLSARRIKITRTHGGASQEYDLPDRLFDILLRHLERRRHFRALPDGVPPAQDFLFRNRFLLVGNGEPRLVGIGNKVVNLLMRRYGARAGLDRQRLARGFALRHSRGVHLLEAGCDEKDVMYLLGIRDVKHVHRYRGYAIERDRQLYTGLLDHPAIAPLDS